MSVLVLVVSFSIPSASHAGVGAVTRMNVALFLVVVVEEGFPRQKATGTAA